MLALTLVLLVVPVSHAATTLNVPSEYATIQAAISAAGTGDEVVVAVGTYYEHIDFLGKAITVRSADPLDPGVVSATVIDGSGTGSVVTFATGEGRSAVLDGLKITNGAGSHPAGYYGGGIYCKGASPSITHNFITANSAHMGAGVSCTEGASPLISQNTLASNWCVSMALSGTGGGAIACSYSNPTIADNQIESNSSEFGGGVYVAYSSLSITGNTFSGNLASNRGGGIDVETGSSVFIQGNLFIENSGPTGGALQMDRCTATVTQNVFSGNWADWPTGGWGGAICCLIEVPATITNNVFHANSANGNGGAIWELNSPLILINNSFNANTALKGGAFYGEGGATPVFRNCIIAGSGGGGIRVASPCVPAVSYTAFGSNAGGNTVGFTLAGTGNLTVDPLFADASKGDLHLKSMAGRWNDDFGWVLDTVHSACIDAGDPVDPFGAEPDPNGGRINMGAYGGTEHASKSYTYPPAAARPDLWVRVAGTPWLGDNVYNTTGYAQTGARTQQPGQTRTFLLRAQNDGTSPDKIKVTGSGTTTAIEVHYFDAATGGLDITAQVTGAGWLTASLAPGAFRDLRVEVTTPAGALGNTTKTVTVTGKSTVASTQTDVVKAATTIAAVRRPDGKIRNAGDAAYIGDGIYNADGMGQTKSQTVGSGVAAVYQLVVENDGNLAEQFKVGSLGTLAGWKARYFDAAVGGNDITYSITHGGWLTPPLSPGGSRQWRMEVTPDSSVAVGNVYQLPVRFRPFADLSKLDVVVTQTTKG